MRTTIHSLVVIALGASLAGGCTFGEQPEVSLVTRDLQLRGEAGSLEGLEHLAGSVEAQPTGSRLEQGAVITLDAVDGASSLATTFDIRGNLGALCTGSSVQMEARSDELLTIETEGAPARMRADLQALRIDMRTQASDEGSSWEAAEPREVRARELTLRAVRTDSEFARVEFESRHTYDGEEQSYGGSFEIARIEQDPDRTRTRTRTWD